MIQSGAFSEGLLYEMGERGVVDRKGIIFSVCSGLSAATHTGKTLGVKSNEVIFDCVCRRVAEAFQESPLWSSSRTRTIMMIFQFTDCDGLIEFMACFIGLLLLLEAPFFDLY